MRFLTTTTIVLTISQILTSVGNVTAQEKKEMAKNTTQLLDQLLLGYDKRLRPGFGGPATVVDVNLNIRSMGPISEIDMAYQMDCYFRQSWVDKRLGFSGSPMKTMPVSISILDRIWKPDTHFFNGRNSYLHTVTSPNKLLRINRDGRILYSMRLTIKASCPMHLESFPMDTQSCPLRFGSHGYGVNDVLYIWTYGDQSSIKMASDMTLSQFDLIGIPAGNESSEKAGAGQIYSTLFASFILRRHMGYFLINVYVPSSLLVVISWVGFWINREATADRIALGVTTVLTMAFLGIDNRRDLPKVPYSTALDYFVGACFAFVLASILQFASVHFFTKHGSGEVFLVSPETTDDECEDEADRERKILMERRSTMPMASTSSFKNRVSKMNGERTKVGSISSTQYRMRHDYNIKHRASFLSQLWNCLKGSSKYRDFKLLVSFDGLNSVSYIDQVARILFPIAFLTFNIFYWFTYLGSLDRESLSSLLSR